MNKKASISILPNEIIVNKIFLIRGQNIMLDSDLADLYQVETKRLKEQVKRNMERFPESYMFELTATEFETLRSQISDSKEGRGGTRYMPMAFTEHGILQLSNVLKSGRAIEMSFRIIDVFVKLRQTLSDNTELRLIVERIVKKTENNTKNIEVVFQYLDELLQKRKFLPARKKIGYKLPKKNQ